MCVHACIISCRLSASCVHISSLLHALVAMKPVEKELPVSSDESEDDADGIPVTEDDADGIPLTSRACAWKPPRKRKSACLKMCDVQFQKYDIKKYKLESMEYFDPRPMEYRDNAQLELNQLLEQVKGKGLCISLMFDPSVCIYARTQRELAKMILL